MSLDLAYCLAFLMAPLILSLPRLIGLWAANRRLNAVDYQQAYYHLARVTGMTFEPGFYASSPHVAGRYRGRPVTINL